MVPAAEICEAFSREIVCTQEDGTLTLEDAKLGNTIVFTAGSDQALVNGNAKTMQAAAVSGDDGVILVELSVFHELLDTDCKYQEEIQSVYLTESGLC